jgi:hypothetical protein
MFKRSLGEIVIYYLWIEQDIGVNVNTNIDLIDLFDSIMKSLF